MDPRGRDAVAAGSVTDASVGGHDPADDRGGGVYVAADGRFILPSLWVLFGLRVVLSSQASRWEMPGLEATAWVRRGRRVGPGRRGGGRCGRRWRPAPRVHRRR